MSSDTYIAALLAKLTKVDGQTYSLDDLPGVESTHLWDLLPECFHLTPEEISSLVDAKRKRQLSFKRQRKNIEKEEDSSVVVTLKYSNRKKVTMSNILFGDITVAFLKHQVWETWPELQDMKFELEGGNNHAINDAFLDHCTFPLHLTVKVEQSGFSDFMSLEKALSYAGVEELVEGDVAELNFPAKLTIAPTDPVLHHVYEDLKLKHALYDPLAQGCEYTRREFISPILVLAATKAGVKLACEQEVEGTRAKGPVDWMAHYKRHGICITEGKKDNISGGIAQNIAQLTALGEKRGTKRAYRVDLPLFGVATTYYEWVFIRLSSTGDVTREAVSLPIMFATTNEQIKDVAERLAGILSSQKKLLDDASVGEAKVARPRRS